MKKETTSHPINPIAMDQNNSSLNARIRRPMIVVSLVRKIGINLSAILCWKLSITENHFSS